MSRKILWTILVLLAGTTICHAAQQDNRKKTDGKGSAIAAIREMSSPAGDSQPAPAPATADPAYVIGPEDMLDISVWKEPDVSRVVPVRPDGRVSLPLIHDLEAAGMSPQQLAGSVAEKLRKYLNDPQVTVIVTAINSQRVFVLGEVLRGGAFPLLPGMTVLQALSSAGGFTTFAAVKRIRVVRSRNGKQVELPFNYRDVLKGDKPDQNIKLEPGDTIIVP
jgi:polysaccharide export outer membrane protein